MNIAKDGYWNEIWGVPEDVEVPDYFDEDAVPQCEGQSAVVTDNNDPRGMGRVRVQFAWQKNSNRKSPWIRMIQPHGGAGKGFHFLPEVGEEVMVSFEGGNAEKPFVLGSHYNGNEKSGYTTENNDLKVIKTRSGHYLEFEELKNITLADAKGNKFHIDSEGSNINITALETINIKCKNFNLDVAENIKTKAGQDIETGAGKDIKPRQGKTLRKIAVAGR